MSESLPRFPVAAGRRTWRGAWRLTTPTARSLSACLLVLAAYGPGSALAQKPACTVRTCPSVPGPYPQPACSVDPVLDDSKGGQWKLNCTNESASGDFVWQYISAKGTKQIGRCVYVQGRNRYGYVRDGKNPRQIRRYWHTVQTSKTVGSQKTPGNEITVHMFAKDTVEANGNTLANQGQEYKSSFDKHSRRWNEIPGSRRKYQSLAVGYDNGDPPDPFQEAEYSTSLRLVATVAGGGGAAIRWSVYEGTSGEPAPASPLLRPGDTVYLDGVSLAGLSGHDSRYSAANVSTGVEFTALQPVALNTGDVLATVISGGGVEGLYYATNVAGADAFFLSVLGGAPWNDAVENTPLYAATAGTIEVVTAVGVPLLSPGAWVLVGATLALMVAFFVPRKGESLAGA